MCVDPVTLRTAFRLTPTKPGPASEMAVTLAGELLALSWRLVMRLLLLPILLAALLLGCRTNESPEGQVNDLQITAQVKAKLASELTVTSVTNISVNSTNGVVTLSGQVDSADLKVRAQALAKSVPKVVRVVNSLQVTSKTKGLTCCGRSLSYS